MRRSRAALALLLLAIVTHGERDPTDGGLKRRPSGARPASRGARPVSTGSRPCA